MNSPDSIAVVGASLAGLSAVRALRAEGYRGSITVVGDEQHLPYDRPPLSKEFLHGNDHNVPLVEAGSDDADQLDATWLLGRRAIGLTARPDSRHELLLADGSVVVADQVVIATGARARTLPDLADLDGVHTLRTLDDARALRDSLASSLRLVVIGAGFIGAEVASSAAALGLDVTIVEASPTPLAGILGAELGALCAAKHGANGVRLRTGVTVARLLGDKRISGVELSDGSVLRCEALVVGIGAVPNVEWAAMSEIDVDNGFLTDTQCRTSISGIYAIGDCARSYVDELGTHHRSEHWTNATAQARTVARTIMGSAEAAATAPYFWSDQYGARLQFAGRRRHDDEPRFVDGDADAASFTVVYERSGEVVAVFALDNSRLFTRYRKQIERARSRV